MWHVSKYLLTVPKCKKNYIKMYCAYEYLFFQKRLKAELDDKSIDSRRQCIYNYVYIIETYPPRKDNCKFYP
jgi:hypothetical protein